MKKLELELDEAKQNGNFVVLVDGQSVKFKKVNGKLVYIHETKNPKARIQIFKLLNVGGVFLFITQMFLFLISVFGLFSTHEKENCFVLDFDMEVSLQENCSMSIKLNALTQTKKPVCVTTSLEYEEFSNSVQLDLQAKKTIKALKISKIILALAIILTVILIVLLH